MTVILISCIIFVGSVCVARGGPRECDNERRLADREGNLGQAALFPWLGVLRVHIHQEDTFKIALTGIVLVKEGYAIANADDVGRIPKRMFREDSKAMFIPRDNEPWFCKLLDYMTHPEYEYSTVNTVALIELDPGEEDFPIKPICWPSSSFDTSQAQLYALGIIDDNVLLEKTIYSIQYVEQTLCREFYNRAGLMINKLIPTHYECGFAKNNKDSCVWDNGMVLASNSTGHWTLVGLGVRGPGCSAPARFLELAAFLGWIDSATSAHDIHDDYRKKAGSRKKKKKKEEKVKEVKELNLTPLFNIPQSLYPFNTEDVQYFSIDRIDKDAIVISKVPAPGEKGNCTDSKNKLIYRDETRVVASQGSGSYKISLYDFHYTNCTCLKIWLEATQPSTAYIYQVKFDNMEGLSFHKFGDTPEDALQTIPIKVAEPETPQDLSIWKPDPRFKPRFISEIPLYKYELLTVYLQFRFEGEGILKWEALGPLHPSFPPRIVTTRRPRRTRSR